MWTNSCHFNVSCVPSLTTHLPCVFQNHPHFLKLKKPLEKTHYSEDRGPAGEGTPSHRCWLSPNSQGLGFSLEPPAAVAASPQLLVAVDT